jgi:hypothetical protein
MRNRSERPIDIGDRVRLTWNPRTGVVHPDPSPNIFRVKFVGDDIMIRVHVSNLERDPNAQP